METDWTILETFRGPFGNSAQTRNLAKVQCKCGAVETRRLDHVTSGRTQRCKSCSGKKTLADTAGHGWLSHNFKGVQDLPSTLYTHYKHGALRRGYEFEVTIEYMWELFVSQEGKCALSGVPLTLTSKLKRLNNQGRPDWGVIDASLDRIDNDKGYVPGNVQWVHKTLNYMKQEFNQDDFIQWCKLVAERHANPEPSLPNDT
jgi:hypothetical protein